MSEAGSVSSTSVSASPSTTSANQTSQTMETSNQNAFENPSTETTSKDPSIKQQLKRLGDADMDALVSIKVNGKTIEKPLREAIKLSQLEDASYQKMQQAAQKEKAAAQREQQLQSLVELSKKDFGKFCEVLGLNADEIAEARLARKYEMMQMSPEQRELSELKQWRAQQEQAQKQQKDEFEKHQMTQAEMRESKNLEQEIIKAWDETKLPKNKYLGAQMAFEMLRHQKINGTPLQANEAAAKVKQSFLGNVTEILSNMDAKAIHEMLGKDIIAKLRKYDVEQVTGKPTFSTQKSPGDTLASQQGPKKTMNEIEWRKAMGLS